MQYVPDEDRGQLHAWVDGSAHRTPDGVPGGVVKPGEELLEAMLCRGGEGMGAKKRVMLS